MRIGNYDISLFKIVNATKQRPTGANVFNAIEQPLQQIYRSKQEIEDFKNALLTAENEYQPNRYLLYKLFNDVVLDGHLSAVIQQRKNLTLCKKFKVINQAGKEDEALSKILQAKWFYDFVDYSLDSLFWGYSLIQFDALDKDCFKQVELVPRIYVKPEKHIVVKDWAHWDGLDYLEEPYKDWVVGVGKPKDLGLLVKASPLAIWKKNAMGAWSDYQMIFGAPFRTLKIDNVTDKATMAAAEKMMQKMGHAAYGIFQTNDLFELHQQGKTDAFEVYNQLIERCNSEMSKLILLQTGTTAEKSFVGSAEVHERILGDVSKNDAHFIESVLNYQLVPMMENLGVNFKGCRISADTKEEMTPLEQIQVDDVLLKYFDIDPKDIEETYGRAVVKKVEPVDTSLKETIKKTKNYYS